MNTPITVGKYAALHGKSRQVVHKHIKANRIKAEKIGDYYYIMDDEPWPSDGRTIENRIKKINTTVYPKQPRMVGGLPI